MRHPLQHLHMVRIGFGIIPKFPLCLSLYGVAEERSLWIPLSYFLPHMIGLYREEVGIQHMAKLMGKFAADLLISCRTAFIACYIRMPCIKPGELIVCDRRTAILGLPDHFDFDTPLDAITLGLSCGYVLEMSCQDA